MTRTNVPLKQKHVLQCLRVGSVKDTPGNGRNSSPSPFSRYSWKGRLALNKQCLDKEKKFRSLAERWWAAPTLPLLSHFTLFIRFSATLPLPGSFHTRFQRYGVSRPIYRSIVVYLRFVAHAARGLSPRLTSTFSFQCRPRTLRFSPGVSRDFFRYCSRSLSLTVLDCSCSSWRTLREFNSPRQAKSLPIVSVREKAFAHWEQLENKEIICEFRDILYPTIA